MMSTYALALISVNPGQRGGDMSFCLLRPVCRVLIAALTTDEARRCPADISVCFVLCVRLKLHHRSNCQDHCSERMGGSPRGPPVAAERRTRRLARVALAALSMVLLLTSVVFLDRQSGLEGALQAVTPFLKELYDSRKQVLRLEARVVQLLEQVNVTAALCIYIHTYTHLCTHRDIVGINRSPI